MFKKYLILIICLFISALSFNILQYPNNIVSGGIPGIAIIINKYLKIDISLLILVISIILLVISYIFLGKEKTLSSIISIILYPICIKLTTNLLIISISNKILLSILIGITTGIPVGIIYKLNFNNGGISIIVSIVSKYTKLSLAKSSFIINILIIVLSTFTISSNMFIYSSIIILINSFMIKLINKVSC